MIDPAESMRSRAAFIEGAFDDDELSKLKARGLYDDYVRGYISINTIYKIQREQGI